ncbi:MAG: L,D-transpeptidase family protein, partial [bacterium]|nr:L,D-transpeptidase family protein [bacterium]
MKRILQITFLSVVMVLLFVSSRPVEAQRYIAQNDGYSSDDMYRPRSRSSRSKIRRSNIKRISPQAARARARNRYKKRRNRRIARRNVTSLNKRRRAKLNKRKVASLKRSIVGNKKGILSRKKQKGPVQIVVSLAKQRVSIYKGGKVIASAKVSTGRSGHRTPAGVFSIIQKHKRHFSNLYNDAPMPYMQRITWSGIALHAGNVSRPYQSHGCIRMPYGFARQLFKSTRMGAHVVVASGSSSLQSINHMSLIQPSAAGSILAGNGVRTAALSDGSSGEIGAPLLESGGIPGFVKPIVAANRHLAKKQLDYKKAVAASPKYELALAQTQKRYEEKKVLLVNARKLSLAAQKRLRKHRYAVRKLKRARASRLRTLNKAQWRANRVRETIEKRIDIPKYVGKWMEMAMARVRKRDTYALKVKARLEEITERFDAATVVLGQLTDEAQNARTLVAKRSTGLRE